MSQLDFQTATTVALGLATAYGISRLAKSGSRDPHLPPGPPTVPFLGNLASLPLENSYLKFTEWARTYGGVYSLKIRSETIIVVSSLDGVHEIMEKNGALTASRPDFAPIIKFSGPGRYLLFTPYGAQWRKFRKVVAELLKPSARQHFTSILVAEASQLLYETEKIPDKLYDHILRYTASAMFSVIAGQRIPQVTSPLCREFFHTWSMIADVCAPGHTPPVYRFRPLNSLLAPHFSTEDQIYKGKLIPKDSTVVLNIWGICHDPELFEDPETFNPDRFIGSQFGMKPEVEKETDSEVLKRWEGLMFGAGRRRCPASQISYDLLGHISASIFWAFELSPPLDEQGREKKLDPWAFECALTNNLHPFKLTIKPRSRRHMQVVKHNYAAATSTFEPFELELAEEDKVYVRNARQELEA
ncbi:hypothetical protein FRC03_000487 [Tulasnella sp. 419]|nr:hypothetical protein FRC03_000487 [Tulasnella sp. 419]